MSVAKDQPPLTQVPQGNQPLQASSPVVVSLPQLSKTWISTMTHNHNAQEDSPQEDTLDPTSALKKQQPKFSLRSTRMTSGQPFKSSIPCCTTKNRNSKSSETRRENAWSERSSTDRSKLRIKKLSERMTKIKNMMRWLRSIISCRRSERKRKLMPQWKRSWTTKIPEISSSIKKNVERRSTRRSN